MSTANFTQIHTLIRPFKSCSVTLTLEDWHSGLTVCSSFLVIEVPQVSNSDPSCPLWWWSVENVHRKNKKETLHKKYQILEKVLWTTFYQWKPPIKDYSLGRENAPHVGFLTPQAQVTSALFCIPQKRRHIYRVSHEFGIWYIIRYKAWLGNVI